MKCKHCDEIISLDDAAQHSCFVGQEVFMDNENNLFAENITITLDKQPAVWDKNATLALLSLYEAKKDMLDHPKKKTKIWEAIAVGLQQDFGIQMSADQVRWKINALIKRYKQCVDNNSKSGRSLMTFEWFDQMDEIFGQQRNAAAEHTVTSKFSHTRDSYNDKQKRNECTLAQEDPNFRQETGSQVALPPCIAAPFRDTILGYN
ncbi:uncharacterized protein [Temnothorax longispinosus]|uniref:uncharacterized protein n=1 Tax=Temnothorax longispinosus TaxID=300112 RepID=UPI003A991C2F